MNELSLILPIITTVNSTEVKIRLLLPNDSMSEMTTLLHQSYRRLAEMGLKFMATHQGEEITLDRATKNALCLVAIANESIIGTIAVNYPGWTKGTPFYEQMHVSHFGQFAVLPAFQNCGLGSLLLDTIEQIAFLTFGATELALDTSEHAHHLIEYYTKRNYRFIENSQWDVTNYKSKIFSKSIEDYFRTKEK